MVSYSILARVHLLQDLVYILRAQTSRNGDAYVKGVLKIDPYDEGPQSYMLSDLLNDFYPHNSPHHDVTDKHIRQSQALNIDTVPSSTSLLSRLRVVLHVLNEENLPDLNCLSVQNSVLTQDLFHNTECVNSPNGPDSQILKPGERVCISCQFAICNGDRLLTIHLPEKVSSAYRTVVREFRYHCSSCRQKIPLIIMVFHAKREKLSMSGPSPVAPAFLTINCIVQVCRKPDYKEPISRTPFSVQTLTLIW
ncbi:uncharacterized protein DEA37_0010145 [Paragonimus westermani]|uniref:Uncharacterized protein n=1 Tax=Paragonimus westermani TaxID=34504 RepID=A0A5J4P3D7_9TREM|nr:uncharacterized protein DEA37_0010145 [Paragonimus westermani]